MNYKNFFNLTQQPNHERIDSLHPFSKGNAVMMGTPVISTNLDVGYEPVSSTLEIEFHSGGIYQYSSVTDYVYRDLMSTLSHGKYFYAYTKNVYPYRKLG